jgi:hypothetical protein
MRNPFRYFNSSPEVIRLTVMMYVRYPLSLRQVEDLLSERGIDICHETVWFWWNWFGPMFAAKTSVRLAHRNSSGHVKDGHNPGASDAGSKPPQHVLHAPFSLPEQECAFARTIRADSLRHNHNLSDY